MTREVTTTDIVNSNMMLEDEGSFFISHKIMQDISPEALVVIEDLMINEAEARGLELLRDDSFDKDGITIYWRKPVVEEDS